MQKPMAACKTQLGTLWFIGSGVLFLLILLQTLFGGFGDKIEDAWGWFLPSIMPTLSLMIAVFSLDALTKPEETRLVNRYIFYLCFCLSFIYIVSMITTILVQPFIAPNPEEKIKIMKQSSIWMGPSQGLVNASLGVFFIKGERD